MYKIMAAVLLCVLEGKAKMMKLVKPKEMTKEEAIAQAYPLREEVRRADEAAMKRVLKLSEQLIEGVTAMKDQLRAACRKCTPDRNHTSRPRILDVDSCALMIVPQTCDKDNVRFAIIRCQNYIYSPNGVTYNVTINGSGYVDFHGSLEDCIKAIKKLIYNEQEEKKS